MKALPSLLLMLFLPLFLFAKDPYPHIDKIDILHYKFEIQLNSETDKITGLADIRFRLSNPQNILVLDLIKKQNSTGMVVDSILMNEIPISFKHANSKLSIPCPIYSATDTLLEIRIHYHGIPEDGLIISKNKFGVKSFFGDNWPDRARHWLPCVDHLSDKATVEFLVKAPSNFQVVANGYQKGLYPAGSGYTYTHYESTVPLPTKVMVIGVAEFAIQTAGFAGQTQIESWVYPENMEEGFLDYSPAVEIVDYYNSKIGAFAFEKLANVQSKTVYGGMENSGAIFYHENSVTGKNTMHSLLAHEIAHQWFGDAVSEADWHHIWLSEGFATYLEAVCISDMFADIDLENKMERSRTRVINYYYRNPKPVIDTTIVNLRRLLSTNSYQKGAWALHMLRNNIGEEAFWSGLQKYYARFKNKNALTKDFRYCMEEASGKNLQQFFDQWLRKSGHPVLKLKYDYNSKHKILVIKLIQTQNQYCFNFPLDIEILNVSQGLSLATRIYVTAASTEHTIKLDFVPDKIILDPDVRLLFEEAK
ncbi:MAG: M1 family aminopeptidase [Bacteroidota bacterium]|nr:M1 family aminopeptidase [Bacteroidota bacterium]